MKKIKNKIFWLIMIVCNLFLIIYALAHELFNLPRSYSIFFNVYFIWSLSTIVFIISGIPLIIEAIKFFIKNKKFSSDSVISFASTIAYLFSVIFFVIDYKTKNFDNLFFYASSVVLFFYQIGHTLETAAIQKNSQSIDNISKILPKSIYKEGKNGIEHALVSDLKINDIILLKKGEILPIDGKLISDATLFSEKIWTGNAILKAYRKNDYIVSGCLNNDKPVKIKVLKTVKKSSLFQMINSIQKSNNNPPKIEKFTDKIANIFFIGQILLGLVAFSGWCLYFYLTKHHISIDDFKKSIIVTITIFVAICPCAFAISPGLILMITSIKAQKNNVLITDFSLIDRIKKINAICFDKTGTLTTDSLSISDFKTLNDNEIYLDIIYNLESYSGHPIAKTVTKFINKRPLTNLTKVEEITGKGIYATWEKKKIFLGSASQIISETKDLIMNGFYQKIILVVDNEVVAGFNTIDLYRQSAVETIQKLKQDNYANFILTGDKHVLNQAIKNTLPPENIYTSLTPKEKSQRIKLLQDEGLYNCLYVGDGINDLLAGKEATAFISIYNRNNDITSIAGDAIMLNADISKIRFIIKLLKTSEKFIVISIFWSILYNITALSLSLFNIIKPGTAGLLMVVSDIILIMISFVFLMKKINIK